MTAKKLTPVGRIKQAAFNATCDMFTIISTLMSDVMKLDDIPQDTWIVTSDEKLADFVRYFSYVDLNETTGLLAEVRRFDEQSDDEYWRKVDNVSNELARERFVRIFSEETNVDKIVSSVHTIHEELEEMPS